VGNRTRADLFADKVRSVLPTLVVARVTLFAVHPLDDPDTWWHLAAGRWIARHWAIPHTDTLSFTVRDHPWINLQWSFDLLLYGLYQLGGSPVLILAGALTFGLAMALLMRNLRQVLGPVGASLITLWVTLPTLERLKVRPELVSFVLLEALLWVFASTKCDDRRRLWLLPLLMIVWVNTHALFVVGVFIIACHMAAVGVTHLASLPWREPTSSTEAAIWPTLLGGSAAVLVTLANPYLAAGAMFPLKLLATMSNPVFRNIGEFRAPFSGYHVSFTVRSYQIFLVASVTVVVSAWVIQVGSRIYRGGRRKLRQQSAQSTRGVRAGTGTDPVEPSEAPLDIAGLLIYIGLAYLSLRARRNMALFVLGVAPFVSKCLLVVTARLPRPAGKIWKVGPQLLSVLIPIALIASFWLFPINTCWSGVWEPAFPIRAAAFAKEMKLPPGLFNDLSGGGYLAWDNPTEAGVYIDARLEVYGPEFFSLYSASLSDPTLWQRQADLMGIRTVLMLHRPANYQRLIRWLLADSRWILVYYDDVAVVFVRRADNQELVTAARERFRALNDETAKRLAGPLYSRQCHELQTEALAGYAGALELIGNADQAVTYYTRALESGPSRSAEADLRLHLAYLYAGRGDVAAARTQLRRAALLDPTKPGISELRQRIGG